MGSLQRLLQFRMITEKISKNCFNRLYSTLLMLRSFKYQPDEVMNHQGCTKGRGRGAVAPPDFGRSEGAAGQRRRPALLPAPPDF